MLAPPKSDTEGVHSALAFGRPTMVNCRVVGLYVARTESGVVFVRSCGPTPKRTVSNIGGLTSYHDDGNGIDTFSGMDVAVAAPSSVATVPLSQSARGRIEIAVF